MPRARQLISLHGWYVISLRPLGLHGGVRRCATGAGAHCFTLSTVRLVPVPARQALAAALACPRVIVTSPAAARFAQAQLALSRKPVQRWLVPGPASARALRRCGITNVEVAPEGTSESLLDCAGLQDVSGHRIGVITAPDGRDVLAATLQARGATLLRAEVYRRQPIAITSARLRALGRLPENSALLVTSAQALLPLWDAAAAAQRERFMQSPCVVSSARLAGLASRLGMRCIVQAMGAQPATLLAALADHVRAQRFR